MSSSCPTTPILQLWNRDVNAAKNMLYLLDLLLQGLDPPPLLCRPNRPARRGRTREEEREEQEELFEAEEEAEEEEDD